MARPKRDILKALTPAHLKGIGEVAATWADLEFSVIHTIGWIAEIETGKIIALVSPNNFAAWLDILERVTELSDKHNFRLADFKAVRNQLKLVNTERNKIVHGTWLPPAEDKTAIGLGMPKRGRKSVIGISYTALQMRNIAKQIADADKALHAWLTKPTPELQRNMLAAAVRDYQKTRQKSPKRKAPQQSSPPSK